MQFLLKELRGHYKTVFEIVQDLLFFDEFVVDDMLFFDELVVNARSEANFCERFLGELLEFNESFSAKKLF